MSLKGVFVRPRWDWDLYSAAVGAYSAPAGGAGTFTQVSLYNNGSAGQYLSIYGIIATPAAAGSFVSIYRVAGAPGANLGFITPCKFDEGVPPGLVYSSALAAVPAAPLMVLTTTQGIFFSFRDTPWFSLPAGYSLQAVNNTAAAALSMSYFYAPLD